MTLKILAGICSLTTAIAIVSVFWAGRAPMQKRVLPWMGGLLLGIGVFWIIPEMAERWGWATSLTGVSVFLAVLVWVDRYVYPICPFCAADASGRSHLHPVPIGWPLLAVGCIHSFIDGWTIAFPSHALGALSWAAVVHKLPESFATGILAARLTSNRRIAIGIVAVIQTAMAAGGLSAMVAGNLDDQWANLYSMPACALLMLFGLLALHQEQKCRGSVAAIRAAAPGLVGCALAALACQIWSRI
jgi:hypothetical protein